MIPAVVRFFLLLILTIQLLEYAVSPSQKNRDAIGSELPASFSNYSFGGKSQFLLLIGPSVIHAPWRVREREGESGNPKTREI